MRWNRTGIDVLAYKAGTFTRISRQQLIALGFLIFQPILVADEPSTNNVAVEVKASFGNFATPLRRLTVSLGELQSDEHIDATIELVNVTQSPIEFLTLRTSCNCLNAEVVNPKVAAQDSAYVLATLHTRLRSFRPDQVTTFQVTTRQDGRVETATIAIEYKLKGIVAFPSPIFHHEIPVGAKDAEVRLPLMVTEPVVGSELEVETELNTLPKLVHDEKVNERWWIVLPVEPRLLKSDVSLFEVNVSDPETGRKSKALVSLTRAAAFRVSPRTMRFRRLDDGTLVASSIVHLANVAEGDSDSGSSDNNARDRVLAATATVNGKPIRVKVESIGRRVFRVESKLRDDQLQLDDSSEMTVHWSLMCGKSKGEVTSGFTVESR